MGSNEVKDMLLDLGKELKRSDNDMQQYIHRIVEENWLETFDDLRELSEKQWDYLNIPVRLVQAIRIRLDSKRKKSAPQPTDISSCSYQSSTSPLSHPQKSEDSPHSEDATHPSTLLPSSSSIPSRTSTAIEEKAEEEKSGIPEKLTAIELGMVDESTFPISLYTACETLELELSSSKDFANILKTLIRIIHGVLYTPKNAKKRRIRKENHLFQETVGNFPLAMDVLFSCGFVEIGDFLELPVAFIARLTDGYQLLSLIFETHGIPCPPLPETQTFNPYQTRFSSTNILLRTKRQNLNAEIQEGDSLSLENVQLAIQRRKEILENGGSNVEHVALNPLVFNQSELRHATIASGLEDSRNSTATSSNQEWEDFLKNSISMKELLSMKEVLSENTQFKSRAKKELETLNKKKIYSQAAVRILFPDKNILQLHFKPTATIQTVYDNLLPFLSTEIQSSQWHIYETPPLRRLNKESTLYEENLVPGGLLHFKLEGKTHFSVDAFF
ncbi:PUB domain-containing protein [Cardiosporidium cionae]|uniref:PUB domain-containing protein n=1 Tax=Cardiosporidium cionae TaxID=476202 RepID=A0ABQ7J9C1_9APIC|nr:PUB domain-containing protein [Cardiosporidium cionae]|eukprot:KAF8820603.1 PUB domain-containing protein [Cardiosporidium cionae]